MYENDVAPFYSTPKWVGSHLWQNITILWHHLGLLGILKHKNEEKGKELENLGIKKKNFSPIL